MSISIRLAERQDAGTVAALIQAHATFDGKDHLCKTTEADIIDHGFGADPVFQVLLAEVDGVAVGSLMFYRAFSSWEGKPFLFIDDFFIKEDMRGRSIGRQLLAEVAALAKRKGCPRVDWHVLGLAAARGFYERLGGRWVEEFLIYRLEGEALNRLAGMVHK
ncbi:GNAT superfamily N-acetyltransferase [Rhodoligotrophos appendicifer]|uniref:GNAT family N-acetyltransferase n=1 Tax=Rhodoligotrophos appendicifer TaxID=987056 RepID=UPI001185529C|nr:GNAT family N-acetyltransferase [Rhodoligotrophos appendicifer]